MAGLNPVGCLLIGLDLALIAFLLVRPLTVDHGDDRGDGLAQVVLPKPRPVRVPRIFSFYAVSLGIAAILAGLRPGPVTAYRALVSRLAQMALDRPAAVAAYAGRVDATVRLVVLANVLAFALVLRATPARRLAVAFNAVLFVGLMLGIDAAGVVVATEIRLPLAPSTVLSSLLLVGVAVVIMLRLLSTAFCVPRPSLVPPLIARDRAGNALLLAGLLLATAVVVCVLDLLQTVFAPTGAGSFLTLFVGLPLIYDGLLLFLLVTLRPPELPVTAGRPPITLVTPAFNEESCIVATLQAMDRAAAVYGGPVTTLLVDDGSSDRTRELAEAAMAGYRAATGQLISTPHQGKAAALNAGLAAAETEIVVRIDADVLIAEDSLVHLPGWFDDEAVGMVGALDLPNLSLRSWYARGRLFECLIGFAFARVALQRLDAVNCIPGTFMAFRVEPARSVGGFVAGMNGEDADLTLVFGRLGYRVMLDTRIRIYEDVPGTMRDFREQRVRWNRAGAQNLNRHSPVKAGQSTPRTWFFFVRVGVLRATAVLRPLIFATGIELGLLDPATRHRAPFVLLLYLISAVPSLMVISVLAVRHGFARHLRWLPVWYPFTLARRVIALEGMLTLPTRTVALPRPTGWGRRGGGGPLAGGPVPDEDTDGRIVALPARAGRSA